MQPRTVSNASIRSTNNSIPSSPIKPTPLPLLSGKRETVLDILTEARASLQKPSRPFTPASKIIHVSNDNHLYPSPEQSARPITPNRRLPPLRSSELAATFNPNGTAPTYRDYLNESNLSKKDSHRLVEEEYDTTAKAHDDFRIHSAGPSRTASAKTLTDSSSEWAPLLEALSLPQNALDRAWDELETKNWLKKPTKSISMKELQEVRQLVENKLNLWVTIGKDQYVRKSQNEETMLMVWDACTLTIKVASNYATISHALDILIEVGVNHSIPSRRRIVTILEILSDNALDETLQLSQESAVILLKSLTLSDTGRDIVVSEGGVEILVKALRRSIENSDNGSYNDIVSEVMATLRNIVADPGTCLKFVNARAIVPILDVLDEELPYFKNEEIMWHASRVLSKLSTDSTCIEALTQCRVTIEYIMGVVLKYESNRLREPLLVRLLFVLGNLTCSYPSRNHEKLSYFVSDIVSLLAEEAHKAKNSRALSDDHAQLLVKLVRLMANMALDKSLAHDMVGKIEVQHLVELLEISNDSEELLLNLVAALANLTFYATLSPNFINGRRLDIAEKVTSYLVHDNQELVVEAIRIIANISRFPDVRNLLCANKAPEIISLLSAHHYRDIAFQACGAIINMATDPTLHDVLIRDGATDGLSDAMENVLEEHDWEFGCVVGQAISNLGRDALNERTKELIDIAYALSKNIPTASNFAGIISQLKI